MGYSTNFYGELKIMPSFKEYDLLNEWLSQRHITFDNKKIEKVLAETGVRCDYVDSDNHLKEDCWNLIYKPIEDLEETEDTNFDIWSLSNYNEPPFKCPGLWSDWILEKNGSILTWNGNEKSYDMVAWVQFLIKYIFAPNGHTVNGEINFQGEREPDSGKFIFKNNILMPNSDQPYT